MKFLLPLISVLTLFTVSDAAPPPKPESKPGRIVLWTKGKIVDFNPEGKDVQSVDAPDLKESLTPYAFVTPNRKIVFFRKHYPNEDEGGPFRARLMTASLNPSLPPEELECYNPARFLLSADGTSVYFSGTKAKETTATNHDEQAIWRYDPALKSVTKLPVLAGDIILLGLTHHEDRFFTGRYVDGKNGKEYTSNLVSVDGKDSVEIFRRKEWVDRVRFSPVGDRLLASVQEFDSLDPIQSGGFFFKGLKKVQPVLYDIATQKRTAIPPPVDDATLYSFSWSPDGTKVASAWVVRIDSFDKNSQLKVFVSDPDGKNAREIYSLTDGRRTMMFDWR
jgi:hypothetical protein